MHLCAQLSHTVVVYSIIQQSRAAGCAEGQLLLKTLQNCLTTVKDKVAAGKIA